MRAALALAWLFVGLLMQSDAANRDAQAGAVARARVDYIAKHNLREHPSSGVVSWKTIPGATFEGIGWRSGFWLPWEIPTCRPGQSPGSGNSLTFFLLSDAVAYRNGISYRLRIWGQQCSKKR